MKKFLMLLLWVLCLSPQLQAQVCKCSDVKLNIINWVCKGKNPAGNPVYEGKLVVTNSSKCKFVLSQIMQQVGGDVSMALPFAVPAGSTGTAPLTFTDNPPFAAAGSTPFFIVVFSLGNGKCKLEFPSEKIPVCGATGCDCNPTGWQPVLAMYHNTTQKVRCGFQFTLKAGEPIKLDSKYLCKGNCVAKYTAVLKNAVTNAVVKNYNPFSFPWSYAFLVPGNYSLEITPMCGDKKCASCRFFFTVTKKD